MIPANSLPRLVLSLSLLAPVAVAQEPHFGAMRSDRGTENRLCDLVAVRLELRLDERAKTFEGRVENELVSLRDGLTELWLDAQDLDVVSVRVGGLPAEFRTGEGRLWITPPNPLRLGRPYRVAVDYRGSSPQRGLYFIHPDEEDPDLGYEIWSQGQSEDNRRWIPTWDYPTDRATFSGEFTVREGLTVVSNGALVEVRPAADEGWATWVYALDLPFPTYLISIGVGDYERYVDDFRGIPVEYYVQRGVGEETARRSFGKTPDMLAFFSDRTGIPYPYPKYSQVAVQNFVVGGMENISATTQTDRTLHDEREHLDEQSEGLVAHELAHQWWGDLLTTRTWRHLWLNEGFATYFEALYTEHDRGTDAFRLEMRENQRSAVGRDANGRAVPLVESFFNRRPTCGGGNDVYVKGSSVLYMIHSILGDELWWRAIRHYGEKHAGELVETQDLEVAIEEATGYNLHWLFEEYVYLPGHPELEVAQRWDEGAKEVVLVVKQVQDTSGMVPVFRYPVPIEVTTEAGARLHEVWLTEAEQEVRLPAESEPLMVRFDKGSAMLKTITFPKSAETLAYQALHDDDVVGRLIAIEQLPEVGDESVAFDALREVLAKEGAAELREVAARGLGALGGLRAREVVETLLAGLRDDAPRVRRQCARQLGDWRERLLARFDAVVDELVQALPSEPSYRTQEAFIDALARLGSSRALPVLREAEGYPSPDGGVAAAALSARLRLRDQGALDGVLALAERGASTEEKARGLELLGSLRDLEGERRAKVAELLIAAARGGNGTTARAAVQSLGELEMSEGVATLRELAADEGGGGRSGRWFRRGVQRSIERIEEAQRRVEEATLRKELEALTDPEEVEKRIEELKRKVEALTGRLKELNGGGEEQP